MPKLSADTTQLYDLLYQDVLHLWWDVNLYRGLFNDDAVEILRRSSEATFSLIQRRLFDAHYLTISRLMDQPHGRRRDTRSVSFASLIASVAADGFRDIAKAMNSELKPLRATVVDVHAWRNSIIAHSDLDMRAHPSKLPARVGFESIETFAVRAQNVMNIYACAFHDNMPVMFSKSPGGLGSPQDLLDRLEVAEAYRNPNLRELPHELLPSQSMQDALRRHHLYGRPLPRKPS